MHYSQLAETGGLKATSASPRPGNPQRTRFVAFDQDEYVGGLDLETTRHLIDEGKAEALERRLTAEAHARLQADLDPLTRALAESAAAFQDEVRFVKQRLIDRPDRKIEIAIRPRNADPAYARLEEARRTVESPGLGAVWADVAGGKEVHFIVRWDEWPILKALRDEQVDLTVLRRDRVRQWIEAAYARDAMDVFQRRLTKTPR